MISNSENNQPNASNSDFSPQPTSSAALQLLPQKLPANTQIYTTSPMAAGLPILEIVKNLEEEKIINREDRAILKDALYSHDFQRREEMIKALCDVELSSNSRFAIRRLKAVIHQNGSGEVSSKIANNKLNIIKTISHNDNIVNPESATPFQPTKSLREEFKKAASVSGQSTYNNNNNAQQHSQHHHRSVSDVTPLAFFQNSPSKPQSNINQSYIPSGMSNNDGISYISNNNVRASFPPSGSRTHHMTQRTQSNYETRSSQYNKNKSDNFSNINNNNSPNNNHYVHNNNNGPQILSARAVLQIPSPTHTKQPPQQSPAQPQSLDSLPPKSRRRSNEISPSSKLKHNINNNVSNNKDAEEDEDSGDLFNVQSTVSQVVGLQPMYSGTGDTFNVLSKIAARLMDILQKIDPVKLQQRKFAILVGSGSFNPLTRMHLRTYFLAKQYLESHLGYLVLGSLLSPAHAVTVRERYRTNPSEIIPAPHRLAIAQLLVQNSQWVGIDPWEMTRRRAMDYLSLVEHIQQLVQSLVQSPILHTNKHVYLPEIKVLYLCKGNMVPKLSPQALKTMNAGCVTVCRAQEADAVRSTLTGKWNGVISVVEDNAILDASFDMVTSRKVRDKIKAGESVETLVGAKIQEYCLLHKIGPKINGEEEWTLEERQMPKIASRPAEPVLKSQQQIASVSSSISLHTQISAFSNNNNINNLINNNVIKSTANNNNNNSSSDSCYAPSWGTNNNNLLQKNGLSALGLQNNSNHITISSSNAPVPVQYTVK